MTTVAPDFPDLHEVARQRLQKQQDFRGHLLVYVLCNALLWTIWALTGSDFAWPAIPAAAWGIGLVMHAWDAYWRHEITEEEVEAEARRLRHG